MSPRPTHQIAGTEATERVRRRRRYKNDTYAAWLKADGQLWQHRWHYMDGAVALIANRATLAPFDQYLACEALSLLDGALATATPREKSLWEWDLRTFVKAAAERPYEVDRKTINFINDELIYALYHERQSNAERDRSDPGSISNR